MSPVIKKVTGRAIKHKISGGEENTTKELFLMWQHKFLSCLFVPFILFFQRVLVF